MAMDLYMHPASPPCIAVMLAEKSIGINLNKKFVDLLAKAHLKEDFLKINPQHTVPVLNDNGFILWESRAILTYLCEKYGKDNSLYPKDPKARAVINQRLYFDMGTLYHKFITFWEAKYERKEPENPEHIKSMETAIGFLDTFLENSKYVAGEHLTLADLSILVSVICYEMSSFDISKYPNVEKWYKLCKTTVPGYPDIQDCLAELAKFF